jgi:hypothetical protein
MIICCSSSNRIDQGAPQDARAITIIE